VSSRRHAPPSSRVSPGALGSGQVQPSELVQRGSGGVIDRENAAELFARRCARINVPGLRSRRRDARSNLNPAASSISTSEESVKTPPLFRPFRAEHRQRMVEIAPSSSEHGEPHLHRIESADFVSMDSDAACSSPDAFRRELRAALGRRRRAPCATRCAPRTRRAPQHQNRDTTTEAGR